MSVEPDTIVFNKDGNEIAGIIILKNITTDKPLSYKVCIYIPFCYNKYYYNNYWNKIIKMDIDMYQT